MDSINRHFIKILSASIKGEKVKAKSIENFDLRSIYNKAIDHNVESLIFSAIDHEDILIDDNRKNIYEGFKKTTFVSSIYQIKNVKQMEKVLIEFNKAKIPVVVLKGLAIREFYPNAEHRTMGDSDLLVKKEDLEKVVILLKKLEYTKGEVAYHHVSFEHNHYSEIEIHWTIKKTMDSNVTEDLTDELWCNVETLRVGQAKALVFKYEYLLLHLIMHISSHIKNGGVGIRQLCDVAVLIKEKENEINWDVFNRKINEYNLNKFTTAIFSICNKLFDTRITSGFKLEDDVSDNKLNELILEILDGGVFGSGNASDLAIDRLTFNSEYKSVNKFKYIINYIFPSVKNMDFKYGYVKKINILLPIGWIHRWIRILIIWNKDLFKVTSNINGVLDDASKKGELIKWLEI